MNSDELLTTDYLLDRLERMKDAIPIYAHSKADRVYIDKYRKSVRARLMTEAIVDGMSGIKAEAYALSHKDYIFQLDALKEATEVESKHWWSLESLRIEFELWRTVQANNRATQDKV